MIKKIPVRTEKAQNAKDLIDIVYSFREGGAGGHGHIVFDDHNHDDRSIECCLKSVKEEMSKTREKMSLLHATHVALIAFKELSVEERRSTLNFIY